MARCEEQDASGLFMHSVFSQHRMYRLFLSLARPYVFVSDDVSDDVFATGLKTDSQVDHSNVLQAVSSGAAAPWG